MKILNFNSIYEQNHLLYNVFFLLWNHYLHIHYLHLLIHLFFFSKNNNSYQLFIRMYYNMIYCMLKYKLSNDMLHSKLSRYLLWYYTKGLLMTFFHSYMCYIYIQSLPQRFHKLYIYINLLNCCGIPCIAIQKRLNGISGNFFILLTNKIFF